MIKYRVWFLNKLKALGFYLVKFCDNNFLEEKMYPSNIVVNSQNKRPVIIIKYKKNTFLINNSQNQVWVKIDNIFL